jgi:ribonuclease HII
MLLPYYKLPGNEAGIDEAGRGCLAGPVVAAAVILPEGYDNPDMDDSKKLTAVQREILRDEIVSTAIDYGIGVADNLEIDQHNILQATFLAMHRAIDKLKTKPEILIIDGNRFRSYRNIPHHCIVKGDSRYLSIAAASVMAKTYRDELMNKLSINFPHYGWDRNAGYPTRFHRDAIREFGLSPYHRRSFRQLDEQIGLFRNE